MTETRREQMLATAWTQYKRDVAKSKTPLGATNARVRYELKVRMIWQRFDDEAHSS